MSLQQTITDEAAAQRAKAAGRRYRRQQSAFDILILFLVVIGASVIYGLISPDTFAFNSFANIQNALYTIPIEVGIPALGVGVLMIAGEFDLSVGNNYIFSSIVTAQLATNGMNVWVAALIGLLIGTGIGLLNGLLTLWLKIPSFITTLGTSFFWLAATFFVHGASSQSFTPDPAFATLTAGSVGVIPATFLWWVVLAVAFWGLLERNRIGNHIFAAGGNKQAAVATGVRVNRTKLLAFALAGTTAALGGILAASYIGNIAPSNGEALPLEAIAACVIGGLALTGGRGTILGTVLGSALIFWIRDVLLLLGAPGFYIDAPIGILIIGAAAFYEVLRSRRS
ncbi:MAG TPA: ABC transporter permease [Ktedonobacteraceae bacterium]|jgi:ribose/xylose/arabinose/galactoside ABC-type transport system permease subunit|nr:ABC transporter permease [Ktedonobacteraceae bacterium]